MRVPATLEALRPEVPAQEVGARAQLDLRGPGRKVAPWAGALRSHTHGTGGAGGSPAQHATRLRRTSASGYADCPVSRTRYPNPVPCRLAVLATPRRTRKRPSCTRCSPGVVEAGKNWRLLASTPMIV